MIRVCPELQSCYKRDLQVSFLRYQNHHFIINGKYCLKLSMKKTTTLQRDYVNMIGNARTNVQISLSICCLIKPFVFCCLNNAKPFFFFICSFKPLARPCESRLRQVHALPFRKPSTQGFQAKRYKSCHYIVVLETSVVVQASDSMTASMTDPPCFN